MDLRADEPSTSSLRWCEPSTLGEMLWARPPRPCSMDVLEQSHAEPAWHIAPCVSGGDRPAWYDVVDRGVALRPRPVAPARRVAMTQISPEISNAPGPPT